MPASVTGTAMSSKSAASAHMQGSPRCRSWSSRRLHWPWTCCAGASRDPRADLLQILRRRQTHRRQIRRQKAVRPCILRLPAHRRKILLLTENGFPPDYLEMTWDCPDCRDTGYIGREKCRCLRRRETAILYDQSHLEKLAEGAVFASLSEKYYTGEDLEHFRQARRTCERFVEEFDQVHRNLYLYGTVGTGKTMLSVCAARALIERGRSVLYFSAASLFDRLADCTFGSGSRDALREFTGDLYSCDLLIIDDLGTEFTNAFVASQLFSCISERELNRHSTIISTNLSLKEMQARYSDRVFSRITSTYEICKLTGKDIRLQQRRRGRR